VLQHGSILLGGSQRRFPDFIRGMDTEKRSRLGRFLARETVSISGSLGRAVTFTEAEEALRRGFERSGAISLKPEPLTAEEKAFSDKARGRFALLKEGRIQARADGFAG